ncbi:peptidase domain-containing ABC transporter [Aquariibacter albus]|uniref:Cyclolysin secretion/processing ATP-binding protein CyaB n=1 Tax=Aquariibacter albus TaxID=2759899 RepID=A0A839HLL2_9BURK|nr:peptidase domain-containing ABC transporter [Aquariibacter albus]MBB1162836.1 peptidase domain-containing ABC transporter [Aquariibacter albus]
MTSPSPNPQPAAAPPTRWLDRLQFSGRRRTPVLLQAEAAECGLACLAMVAGHHGLRIDLATLRQHFQVSLAGATLAGLMAQAGALQLATRAVKLQVEDMKDLRMPAVLHWDFNHFVVLTAVDRRGITLHDPSLGQRHVPWAQVGKSFTGVALEAWPNPGFKPAKVERRIPVTQLLGRISGWLPAGLQIIGLALVLELFGLLSPLMLQWTMDHVLVSADLDLLVLIAVGFAALVLMQQLITLLRSWLLLVLSTTLALQWRANLFSHLLRLPAGFFEVRHLGDVVSRFGAADTIQRTLTSSFVEALLDGLMSVLVLVMMFLYSPVLAAVALGTMAVYGVMRLLWYRPLREATEEQIVHAARQQSHFLETVRGIRAIQLFGREPQRRDTWLARVVEQMNAELRTQKLELGYRLANGLLFGLERVGVIAFGASLVLDGVFTAGALLAFLAYKDQFAHRVSVLIDRLFELRMLRLHGERLADIALAKPQDPGPAVAPGPAPAQPPALRLEGLRFRYGDGLPWVLDGLDLDVPAGSSLAIVGASGSGKSTLAALLLGLREPAAGQILVDGLPGERLGRHAMRALTGAVTQADTLFAGSIADNITFFDAAPDRDWMEACARAADIHADIAALPMAYHTLVGDMGTVLSGGQQQRVLLARALYKRPRLLVLDEATSHLDLASEQRVSQAVARLQLTRILIAHRPQTIASADRVALMQGGRIVRVAGPDELPELLRRLEAGTPPGSPA